MANAPIAYDTETDGLSSFHGYRPFAVSLCEQGKKPAYIELGKNNFLFGRMGLENGDTPKVFHNAKFDVLMLEAYGERINGDIHDTMIMANVFDPDEKNLKLKFLAEKHLGIPPNEQDAVKDYMKKHKSENYKAVPREIMEPYALQDAKITMGLFEFYESKGVLQEPTYRVEKKILKVLIDMERRGVLIDKGYLEEQERLMCKRLGEIEAKIAIEYGEINVASNKQLGDFLFIKEKIQCNSLTVKGNPSLDEYNLEQYDHPIIPLVIEYRKTAKILKTYIRGISDKLDKYDVIHCNFWQLGAKTGRFSCRQPNLQNIPREDGIIRRAFICRPDYTNYYFDYSQIELRILAHYSKEQAMIDTLTDPDGDLHAETAAYIFGDDFTSEHRSIAKTINFGIIYGMGPKKLSENLQQLFPEGGYTYDVARSFINRYYFNYPAVRQFTWAVPRAILNKGFVKDVYERKYTCSPAESYKSVNYLIQGCAASVLKHAMIKVHSLLRDKKSNILLTIHDELVIEIHKDEEDLVKKIKKMMEDYDTFRVPITVKVEKTTTNWSDKALI